MFRKALAFSVLSSLLFAVPAYADGYGRRGHGPRHYHHDHHDHDDCYDRERTRYREEQRRIDYLERQLWRERQLSWLETREPRQARWNINLVIPGAAYQYYGD